MKLNTYVNESGYEIKATEKAFNLFYKKQGFCLKGKPAEESEKRKPAAAKYTKKADSEAKEKSGKEEKEQVEKDAGEKTRTEEKQEKSEKDGEQTV